MYVVPWLGEAVRKTEKYFFSLAAMFFWGVVVGWVGVSPW